MYLRIGGSPSRWRTSANLPRWSNSSVEMPVMVETSLSQLALFDFIVTFSLYGNHRVLFGRACWFLAGAQVAVLPARLPQRAAWAGCAIGRLVCNASLGHVNAQMGRYDRHVRRIRPTPDSLTTFPAMRAGSCGSPTVNGRVPVGGCDGQDGHGRLCLNMGHVVAWWYRGNFQLEKKETAGEDATVPGSGKPSLAFPAPLPGWHGNPQSV